MHRKSPALHGAPNRPGARLTILGVPAGAACGLCAISLPGGDDRANARPRTIGAVDVEPPADGLHPVGEPPKPGSVGGPGPAPSRLPPPHRGAGVPPPRPH